MAKQLATISTSPARPQSVLHLQGKVVLLRNDIARLDTCTCWVSKVHTHIMKIWAAIPMWMLLTMCSCLESASKSRINAIVSWAPALHTAWKDNKTCFLLFWCGCYPAQMELKLEMKLVLQCGEGSDEVLLGNFLEHEHNLHHLQPGNRWRHFKKWTLWCHVAHVKPRCGWAKLATAS